MTICSRNQYRFSSSWRDLVKGPIPGLPEVAPPHRADDDPGGQFDVEDAQPVGRELRGEEIEPILPRHLLLVDPDDDVEDGKPS
jgi:hypothetical protein